MNTVEQIIFQNNREDGGYLNRSYSDFYNDVIFLLFSFLYSLDSNSIGIEGAKTIASALDTNAVLHTLMYDTFFQVGGYSVRERMNEGWE